MAVLLRVPEVEDPDFIAEMTYADGAVLRLTGSADKTATVAIAAMFTALHDEMCTSGTRALVLDMKDVEYMSARCFRQLLAWVGKVQELDKDKRYKIRLRGNPSLAWQKHSLGALACFDTEMITLEGSWP
jgi:anti-anti-sigma regulatory factor